MKRQQRRKFPRIVGDRLKCGLCLSMIILLITILIVLSVYFLMSGKSEESTSRKGEMLLPILQEKWEPRCPVQVMVQDRYDCYPELGGNARKCQERGCCWMPPIDKSKSSSSPSSKDTPTNQSVSESIPVCIYPDNYGYILAGEEQQFVNGFEVPLVRLHTPPRYGSEAMDVRVRVEMQTPSRLRIKFYSPSTDDSGDVEDTIPVEKPADWGKPTPRRTKLYAVSYRKSSEPFGLQVRRVDTGTVIFNTLVSGMTFGNQFVQLTSKLPSRNIYGLGPLIPPSPGQSTSWQTWSLFAGNLMEKKFVKSHGGHPMYMCLEDDGNAHAVLLHSSYPMDLQLQQTPALTYRVLGGPLDFYIFLGPKPDDVLKQYTEAVGRPFFPPYWSLGFQISLMGATDIQAAKDYLRDVDRNNISYDVISLGNEYKSDGIDFTVDYKRFTNLPMFVEEVARARRHIDISVDPALNTEQPKGSYLPFEEGQKLGLFVNNSLGNIALTGWTDSGKSVFVDFGHEDVTRWWTRHLERLRSLVRFHALTLVNNYPFNWANGSNQGCAADNYNNPPYTLRTLEKHGLPWETICMDSRQFHHQHRKAHYRLHNQYGHDMLKVTDRALSKLFTAQRRTFILSQSTFVGSGKYGGYWQLNNTRDWSHLQNSINVMLSYNLYGVSLVGSAICGTDVYAEDDELCVRWIQLGAFYPLSRMPFDPIFCTKMFGRAAKTAIDTRYELLPYLYTLFLKAATTGAMVARPLFYDFSKDKNTFNITSQFMWGSALMIAPVLHKSLRVLDVYLPRGYWYFYHTGGRMLSEGNWIMMEAPLDRINVLVRGGHIIPTQPAAPTTFQSRRNLMHLVAALDEGGKANGFLYWDDGLTRNSFQNREYIMVNFTIADSRLTVSGQKMRSILPAEFTSPYFTSVDIMGLPYRPAVVTVLGTVGVLTSEQFIWDGRGKVLQLREIIIPLTETVEIEWRWTRKT